MSKSKGLLLGGVEVCDSFLTQRAYRAVPCEWLLPVNARNRTEMLAEFKRVGEFGPYRGLRVSGLADLSFLSEFPNLLYLEIADQKKVDLSPLASLTNLRGLRIETPGTGIDFGWFPELEVFVGDWHVDNRNLQRCRELHQLRAWGFKPDSRDLNDLANIPRLEWLQLVQTNVETLAGIETLEDLRYLEIGYAPQLRSLDALATGELQLRDLELSHAKKIESYEPLAALRWLRRLKISSCAPLPNLRWIRGLSRLDMFTFVETNVVDGDLSMLLELPELRYVGSVNKKHYNHNVDKLNEQLQARHAEND